MTPVQKVVKYFAIALAVFIIINIVSGILIGFSGLSHVLGLRKNDTNQTANLETLELKNDNSQMKTLKIQIEAASLQIRKADTLKIESNSKDVFCSQNNNALVVKEENQNWFAKNNDSEIIIYIPEDVEFEMVDIEAGAGKINIEELETQELKLELGAGKVEIQNLNVNTEARIEGGAGNVAILSGNINDLDLSMGVGKFEIKSTITGNSKIDAGIGEIDIDLEDNLENYKIEASKGIGSITVDGKEISDGAEYGNGDSYIKINGGIGSIKIK